MTNTSLTLDLRSYNSETLSHEHNYHQLVLPVRGGMEMSVAGKGQRVSDTTAAIVSAGQEHGCYTHEYNQFLVADIPVSLAPELERLPEFIELDPALFHYVAFLQAQVSQAISDNQTSKLASERQMILLLLQLLQERFGRSIAIDKRVEVARCFIEENFTRPLSLTTLANAAHISPRQLSELFKQQLGMTPQQYLTEKRMQQAWQQLETTAKNIQQIALDVGYTSQAAFSDRFKKHFGKSPKHFR